MNPVGVKKRNTAYIPKDYIDSHYVGNLYGWLIEKSGVCNICYQNANGAGHIGVVYESKPDDSNNDKVEAWWEGNQLVCRYKGTILDVQSYEIQTDIFSRNEGILECQQMLDSYVVISGCGSVGSLVALELARAGVGNFVLIDNDILQYHNICRHQCDCRDVGKYKSDALSERIRRINPKAKVVSIVGVLEQTSKEVFNDNCIGKNAIIVGCADNREADIYANSLAAFYNIPFVSIGFWERAFAGEIFYYIPGQGMPCYECAVGSSEMSARTETNHRFYTTQQSLENVNFEPGISVDISFVTIVGIKLIIDILNRYRKDYTQRLLPHLSQFTLVCNTNDRRLGGDMAEIFAYPLQVTTSLQVGFGQRCSGKCQYENDEKE